MLKTTFQKAEPEILIYRDFEKFTFTNFQSELTRKLYPSNSYE